MTTAIQQSNGFDPQSSGHSGGAGGSLLRFGPEKALAALRRYWWGLTLGFVIGSIASAAWFFLAPATFVCKAAVWETEKMKLPEGATFSDDQQNYMGTQVELLHSEKMKEAAWDRLRSTGTNTIPPGRRGKPYEVDLRLIQPPKSTLIFLEASSPYPAYTQAFLDALLNEYLDYKKSVRKVVSGDTLSSISEQVLRMERELKDNQEGLTSFQRTNNLAVLHEEGTIAGAHLAQLKTRLSDLSLESKLLEATALEKEAATTNGGASLIGSTATGEADSAASLAAMGERQLAFKEFELLKIQREKLAKYLGPKHPRMIKLNDEIERAQKIVDLYRSQTQDQLAASRSALKMKMDSVLVFIREAEIKVEDANARIAEGERLKQNVARIQTLYDRLVLLLQNVDISRNVDQSTTAILQNATEPERGYRHDVTRAAIPLFATMALSFSIVLLVARRDDRFNSIRDVTERFGEVIIGQVPELATKRNGGGVCRSMLLENNDARHGYAESYRNLRSAIHFLPVAGDRPRLLLVTSAVPGEGKSSISVNLARAMALGGSRVLLVDGDLRKGHLHELLNLQRQPGLADVLQGDAALERSLQTDSFSGLAFLPRGCDTSNPGDLFLSPACGQLLGRMRTEYDYVVIDSCPVFAADDVTTLAPKADATLFVVSSGRSRAHVVSQALDLLQQRQAKLLGLVLNRADASSRSYNFYKYAEYHHRNTLKN